MEEEGIIEFERCILELLGLGHTRVRKLVLILSHEELPMVRIEQYVEGSPTAELVTKKYRVEEIKTH